MAQASSNKLATINQHLLIAQKATDLIEGSGEKRQELLDIFDYHVSKAHELSKDIIEERPTEKTFAETFYQDSQRSSEG